MRDPFAKLVLGLLLAIMLGWILVIGRPVILPIAAGLIVAYIVLGLTELLSRLPGIGSRIPAALRLALAVVGIVGVLVLLVSVVVGNVGLIVADAPQYQDRLLALIQAGAVKVGIETEPTWRTLREQALAQVNLQRLFGAALASATAIVATTTIVLIYAGFLLAERNAFDRKIARLSDDPVRVTRIREIIGAINSRVGAYLVTKTLINVLLGVLSYAILRVFGVEYAGFWAILIGLLNYIPYVGGFIGVSLPVALGIVQFGALGPVLALTAALSLAQFAIGNFLEPWLMGASLNLSPFVILVSLVVWTAFWGIPGAILSVPIMAILVIVLSEFEGARPIAVLLSKDGDIAPARGRG